MQGLLRNYLLMHKTMFDLLKMNFKFQVNILLWTTIFSTFDFSYLWNRIKNRLFLCRVLMICTDAQEKIKYLSLILHMPQGNILPLTLLTLFLILLVFFFSFCPMTFVLFFFNDIHSYFFLPLNNESLCLYHHQNWFVIFFPLEVKLPLRVGEVSWLVIRK